MCTGTCHRVRAIFDRPCTLNHLRPRSCGRCGKVVGCRRGIKGAGEPCSTPSSVDCDPWRCDHRMNREWLCVGGRQDRSRLLRGNCTPGNLPQDAIDIGKCEAIEIFLIEVGSQTRPMRRSAFALEPCHDDRGRAPGFRWPLPLRLWRQSARGLSCGYWLGRSLRQIGGFGKVRGSDGGRSPATGRCARTDGS